MPVNMQKFLDAIDNMPSLPNIVVEVNRLAQDDEATADDVVKIVQFDQAITANCLKVCNSAMFGARQKISSLKDAVVYLGFKNLIKIVLASSALDVFKIEQPGYGMKKGELWRHSISTSIFAQLLSEKIKIKNDSTLFTAALLHDIGKLALDSFVATNLKEIMELKDQGYNEVDAEKEVLGVDHAKIGGLIAKRWQFPSELVDAIQNHHTVLEAIDVNFYVRVSNILANIACASHDGMVTALDVDLIEQLGLSNDDINNLIQQFPLEIQKASELLNL